MKTNRFHLHLFAWAQSNNCKINVKQHDLVFTLKQKRTTKKKYGHNRLYCKALAARTRLVVNKFAIYFSRCKSVYYFVGLFFCCFFFFYFTCLTHRQLIRQDKKRQQKL